MKKIVLIVLLALYQVTHLFAQPKVETSRPFDEPGNGWNKLLQLKNGSTFFFHFNKKDGIDVVVYDKTRKQVAERTLESNVWDAGTIKRTSVVGLYDIAGQAAIFLTQIEHGQTILYRVCLDAATGKIASEKEIGRLPPLSFGTNFDIQHHGVKPPTMVVEKDPVSDNYATVVFNPGAEKPEERMEVVQYDGNHNEINRAFYNSPGDKYKYLDYLGMAVDGDRLFLSVYVYNTDRSGGEEARVAVAKLNKGEKEFKQVLHEFKEKFDNTTALFQYNKATDRVQMLTFSLLEAKTDRLRNTKTYYYLACLTAIKGEDLTVDYVKQVVEQKANDYFHNKLGKTKELEGTLQQMILNKDNTVTVLTERLHSGNDRMFFGNIGITIYDQKGEEADGYAILKAQGGKGNVQTFELARRQKGLWSALDVSKNSHFVGDANNMNVFMSYDYINSDKSKYIIFNDLPKNADEEEDEEHTKVTSVSYTNTMCYKLEGGALTRSYLFGTPKDDDHNNFCFIEASNYLKETNTYATIMMARNGKDKVAKIAWVTFD